jgi:phosphoglucosamine mutase
MKRLFGADGIRGLTDIYPLRPADAERLGSTIAAYLRVNFSSPTYLIATDTRESSQRIKNALVNGLTHGGVRVIDAGVLPTAAVSFLVAKKGLFAGGVMVSASHNPIVENGIKLFDERGMKVADEIEDAIEELFFSNFALPYEIHAASFQEESMLFDQYIRSLVRAYHSIEAIDKHIVVDCANGAAFRAFPAVMEALHIPFVLVNADPDGTNINWQAGSEHTRMNPGQLAARLEEYGASLGIAFDGDADRVVMVDRCGTLFDGDSLMGMLALRLKGQGNLNHHTVVTTSLSNTGLEKYLGRNAIQMRRVSNSDRYVSQTLVREDLSLGGEQIGHVVIHDDPTHVTGDGLRTALLTLSALAEQGTDELACLAPGLEKYPQIKVSVHLGRVMHTPPEEIAGLADQLDELNRQVPDLTQRVCRPASTEPYYRIMLEAEHTPIDWLTWHARRLAGCIQRGLDCLGMPVDILDCVRGGRVNDAPVV